ncbi:hypothetical protein KCU65_g2815, partial [Aureobasidium melanogenum]
MDSFDPFDPQSIARHNFAQTPGQRLQREQEWTVRLGPHLSDDQLHHWITVAEELLAQGFDGNYGQTQRLARSVRQVLLTARGLAIEPAPMGPAFGPLLQALRVNSQPGQPAPSPLIQSLINARDFRPSAASLTQDHAEDLGTTVNQSQDHAEGSQPTAEKLRQHAEEPEASAQESHQHAQQPQTTVSEPHQHAISPQIKVEHLHQHAESPRVTVTGQLEEPPRHSIFDNDGDDDASAPLNFTHGKKRERQVSPERR